MSALTKIFVGLLVVCSLILSAAVVVFVNKTEDFNKAAQAEKASLQAEMAKAQLSEKDALAAKANLDKALQAANGQIQALQADIKTKEQDISKAQIQVADLSSKISQQAIALASTGEALKASEDQKTQQTAQLADLRTGIDKATKEKVELNQALSDATNKLDVMTREWRFFKEQLAEAQGQAGKLAAQVKDLGANPATPTAGLKAGAPAINGVIRQIAPIDGKPWATISVGSADSVTRGMEFKVIDRATGTFLGILTIDTVQPNEAAGVLVGPKVAQIRAGNEVRTQL